MNQEKPAAAELIAQLESKDPSTVIKALGKLARSGSPNDLPGIIRAMAKTTDPSLIEQFTLFLSNLKSKKAPEILAGFLIDPECAAIRTELTRSCWESQLDYSPFLMLFARLFITGDFMEALEAFSVIESTCLDQEVAKPVIIEIIALVSNSIPDQTEEKKRLAVELIRALKVYV